jgi:hypothetical protein
MPGRVKDAERPTGTCRLVVRSVDRIESERRIRAWAIPEVNQAGDTSVVRHGYRTNGVRTGGAAKMPDGANAAGDYTAREFKDVTESLLDMVSRHPEAGPRLSRLGLSALLVFTDLGLSLSLRPAANARQRKGHNLTWRWVKSRPKPEPSVVVEMTSVLANRCAQGKEVVPLLVARGSIGITGTRNPEDRDAALDAVPVLISLQKRWVAELRSRGFEKFLA